MVVEESTLGVANCGMGQNRVTEEISWVGRALETTNSTQHVSQGWSGQWDSGAG